MKITPIVSVTYENERISIKNNLPYLKCVLRLSCVVHRRDDLWPFYGFYANVGDSLGMVQRADKTFGCGRGCRSEGRTLS